MSTLYHSAKAEVEKITEACEITDRIEIDKMIMERIKTKMVEVGEMLTDSLNIMDEDVHKTVVEGLLQGINRSHRYLQGEFWQNMLKVINEYGNNKHFDGRNHYAVEMCKRMAIAGEDSRTMDVLQKHLEDHRL